MTFEAIKDPQSTIDYKIDWSATLSESSPADTISTSTWSATGLTVASESETTTTTTVWCSGGTVNQYAQLVNTIVTSGGRTYERTINIKVQHT